jgi:integrase
MTRRQAATERADAPGLDHPSIGGCESLGRIYRKILEHRGVALYSLGTWAERRGHVAERSPTHGVETQKGDPEDRILSPTELRPAEGEEGALPFAVAAVRLILPTGVRREEIVRLRWREFDAAGSCLRLERTKTGRSMRPIGSPVVAGL